MQILDICIYSGSFFLNPLPATWQAASIQVQKHLFQSISIIQEPCFYYLSPPDPRHPWRKCRLTADHSHTSQSQTTLPLTRFHLTLLECRLVQSRCAQLPLHEWVIVHCRKAQGSSSYTSQATRSKTTYWKANKVLVISAAPFLVYMYHFQHLAISKKRSEPYSLRNIQYQAVFSKAVPYLCPSLKRCS